MKEGIHLSASPFPNVAAAHVSTLQHYPQYGVHEGHVAINDGIWA